METEVFVEKIENLVNEFTKNINNDNMEINWKDCRILFKKKEIINDIPYENRWDGAVRKQGYNVQYCSYCGRPIYYNGTIVPTLCSYCEH